MPPELALRAFVMDLEADIDFLKMELIGITFLKIVRIFLNQNVGKSGVVRKYMWKVQNCPKSQFRKIRSKNRNQVRIHTNFRKRAVQENESKCR